MKKESFLKGAVILIIANAVSKILGAVLKIPLTYILGEEGMAIYHTAFSVYIMLLSLIISGMPFAISKLVSQQLAEGKYTDIHFTMRISTLIMSLLGLIGSVTLYFGAEFFAFSMKDPKAVLAIKAISPAIFFVALGAVYKSCFQGYSHMTPTAVSQMLESLIKLLVGYSLAKWFAAFSIGYSSAAAIFGVTIGEMFATFLLFLMYIPYKREFSSLQSRCKKREILAAILSVAVPLTATSTVSSSLSLLETSVIRNCLTTISFTEASARSFLLQYSGYTDLFDNMLETKKLSFDGARWLYGAYTGYAMTVFNLPLGILSAFSISILPVITRCITLNDKKSLSFAVNSTVKIILLTAVPFSAILALFSEPILHILFKNTASAFMLSCMAPMLAIIAVLQLMLSIQYTYGRIFTPFLFGLGAITIKIVLSYILIHISALNIIGAVISSFAAILFQLVVNTVSLKRALKITFFHKKTTSLIILFTVIMSVIAYLLYPPFCIIFKRDILGFSATIFVAAISYLLLIFSFGVITKKEIRRL